MDQSWIPKKHYIIGSNCICHKCGLAWLAVGPPQLGLRTCTFQWKIDENRHVTVLFVFNVLVMHVLPLQILDYT
jgi:hypothetical protein